MTAPEDSRGLTLAEAIPDKAFLESLPEAKPWPINHLPSIGERLRTQDNQCTAEPMFCVQVLRRDVGYDPIWNGDDTVWIYDGDEVEPNTPGATETGYKDRWETVMVAFTEAGAQDYIRQNGHNHKGEKRIYVESFRRCEEMIAIRAFLREDPVTEIAALKAENRLLRDPLAVIHRDGGHYTEEHGVKKSVEDALKILADNARVLDSVQYQSAKLLEAAKRTVAFLDRLPNRIVSKTGEPTCYDLLVAAIAEQ